jgi:hypothetical protein
LKTTSICSVHPAKFRKVYFMNTLSDMAHLQLL